jgi:type IX secretion system PorP/SprF family membrane protein
MRLVNKFISCCIIAIVWTLSLSAQQLPIYSQYIMNGVLINPAVAGSDGFTTLGLSSIDQWLGFPNSPKTFIFSAQGRLMRTNFQIRNSTLNKKKKIKKRSGRVGIGAYVFNDQNGLIERTGAQFTYAYHLRLRENQLSLGVAISTFQFKINQNFDPRFQEPLLNQDFANQVLIPDATVGAYFLTSDEFLGLSIANLFQTRIKIGSGTYDYRTFRSYYLMGGKRFLQEEIFSYEPSFLLSATEQMLLQADLQMRFYYKGDYYLGLLYRTGSAVGVLIGVKWDRFQLGYAFNYTLSSIQRYSYGSHEISLALKLGDNARRYKWLIRY